MSHIAGRKGHMKDAKREAHRKGSQSRERTYMVDNKLIPRVRKFLDGKSSTDATDAETIVTHLQKVHPEYRRKKRVTLRLSVVRALDVILDDEQESSDHEDVDMITEKKPPPLKLSNEESLVDSEDSFSADGEYTDYQNTNAVNSIVTELYSSQGRGTQSASLSSSPLHTPAAVSSTKKTGFVRCQSDPILNKHLQVDGLAYIDRGENPSTPLNHTKLIESMPASPLASVRETSDDGGSRAHNPNIASRSPCRPPGSSDRPPGSSDRPPGSSDRPPGSSDRPVVITIGDDELDSDDRINHSQTATPVSSNKRDRSTPGSVSTAKKKRKSSNTSKHSKTDTQAAGQGSSVPTKKKGAIDAVYSTTTFSQIGGNEKTIEEVQKLLLHMRYPEVYIQIGVTPPRGFLLHGPPGCGKSLMAHAIAGELGLPFYKLAATELVSGVSGESEERVRNLFSKAAATAPCILFIDEVDAITPKRDTASKDMERRIVSQFLTCLDDLCERKDAHVLVIGATNRPDSLDPALRRAGRFDREICMGIPDIKARQSILRVLCKDIRVNEDFDYEQMSRLTPGFVGADLGSLVREAAMCAVNRIFMSLEPGNKHSSADKVVNSELSADEHKEQTTPVHDTSNVTQSDNTNTQEEMDTSQLSASLDSEQKPEAAVSLQHHLQQTKHIITDESSPQDENAGQGKGHWWTDLPSISPQLLESLHIESNDFMTALSVVQPSAKREGFATVPDVTWDDIGALKVIREELQMAILAPVKYPEQFKSLGLNLPSGVLLAGPPGCGKTLLAKAIANESGINFISVKGPELINMYVGESEKAVRQVFQRARSSSPCVVFFDELDSLCPRRSLSGDGGSGARVVNQLLTEMDGLEERKQVFVMGATNRPDIIDPAVMRPGRLDKTLHVGLPTLEDRVDILNTITKKCTRPRIEGVDLSAVAALPQCEGFSGADLTALVREASMSAMREYISGQMRSSSADNLMSSDSKQQAPIIITQNHFDMALERTKPSISIKDREHYRKMSSGVK